MAVLPAPGELFEDKYEIVSVIGTGGFAQVFLARVKEVGRDVAIKILMPNTGDSSFYPADLDRRFLKEAQTLSNLHDPHTITLFDFGRTSSGLLYMVFEFIDGTPLHDLINKIGALEQARVLKIARQVLSSLKEAHAAGILHRDIKPANIMVYEYLGESDHVKVLDFGIAKSIKADIDAGANLTREGTILGTPRYMSPEQICRDPLQPTTDIYSLGLVCFELLTGINVIQFTLDTDIVRVHLHPDPFVLPQSLGIHPGVRTIIETMVQKDFRNRYQSASECMAEIDALLASGALEQTMPMSASILGSMGSAKPMSPSATNSSYQEKGRAVPAPVPNHANPGFGAPSQGFSPPQSQGFNAPPQFQGFNAPPQSQGFNAPPQFQGFNAPPQSQGFNAPPQSQGFNTPPQSQGFNAPPASTGFQSNHMIPNFQGNAPALVPAQLKTELVMDPQRFDLTIPVVVSKTSIMVLGGAFVGFFLLYVLGSFLALFALLIFVAFLGIAFSTSKLTIIRGNEFELKTKYIVYEHPQSGPTEAIVKFEAKKFMEDLHLTLIKQNGEITLCRSLPADEVNYLVEQGNKWLSNT